MRYERVCDCKNVLFYLDPPYLHNLRHSSSKNCYKHEYSEKDHIKLLNMCLKIKGNVVISGYDNELYNSMLAGWKVVFRDAMTDGRKNRKEVLWIKDNDNPLSRGAFITADIKRKRTETKISDAIRMFLSQNKKPTFTAVANKLNMSREHLSRNYKYLFCDISYTEKAI